MARVKGAMMTRKHRNKILKLAKGYWGNKHRHFKMANEQMMKSGRYAYIGRKQKKRNFRQLWITRISAACKANGINYSKFMHGLKVSGIDMNRKMLSEMAIHDVAAFTALVEIAKNPTPVEKKVEVAAKVKKAVEKKVEAVAEEKKETVKKATAKKAAAEAVVEEKKETVKKVAAKKVAAKKAEDTEEKKPAAKRAPRAKKVEE